MQKDFLSMTSSVTRTFHLGSIIVLSSRIISRGELVSASPPNASTRAFSSRTNSFICCISLTTFFTAADTKDSILAAGKEGVDAYIIKPFSVKTIMDKIQEAVDARAKD